MHQQGPMHMPGRREIRGFLQFRPPSATQFIELVYCPGHENKYLNVPTNHHVRDVCMQLVCYYIIGRWDEFAQVDMILKCMCRLGFRRKCIERDMINPL